MNLRPLIDTAKTKWGLIRAAILNKCQFLKVLNEGEIFYLSVGIVVFLASLILLLDKKSELLATLWISAIAAVLSFNSYIYTKEKFRLDLLDKRWEIYEKTLEFCSVVMSHATLVQTERNQESIQRGLDAAQASFRGIGYHKTRALFGKDIEEVFEKINKSYAWLSSGFSFDSDPNYAENRAKHVMFVVNTSNKLPDLFKPYIYFGDYKRHVRPDRLQ